MRRSLYIAAGFLVASAIAFAQTHTVLTNDQNFTVANGNSLTGTYECSGGGSIQNCGSGAASSIISGSGGTAITSGADQSVCFDDSGVINCGDLLLKYVKTTPYLLVGSSTDQVVVTAADNLPGVYPLTTDPAGYTTSTLITGTGSSTRVTLGTYAIGTSYPGSTALDSIAGSAAIISYGGGTNTPDIIIDARGGVRFGSGGTAAANERFDITSTGATEWFPPASTPTPSAANHGAMYYDSGLQQFRCSTNGSVWGPCDASMGFLSSTPTPTPTLTPTPTGTPPTPTPTATPIPAVVVPLSGTQATATGATTILPLTGSTTGTTTGISQVWSYDGTYSNMICEVSGGPGAGASWTFTLEQNGSNSTLTCQITNASSTINGKKYCEDLTHTITVTRGDRFIYNAVAASSPTSTTMGCSLQFRP